MPKDVQDILIDGQNELSSQIARMREQMAAEHKALGERVSKLEERMKLMLFGIGPAGVIIGIVIREVILRWF